MLLYSIVFNNFLQQFLAQSDSTKSGEISLAEFIHYVIEHEKKLRLQFSHLDKNKDGNNYLSYITFMIKSKFFFYSFFSLN